MADISNDQRRENYKRIRKAGYPVSFATRIRDCNPTRVNYWANKPYQKIDGE